jgi:AcrR family transcriptional regulator
VNDAPQTLEDMKRARVFEGAMKMFLAYGFSRTTMDDIARASDISRPALYLLFKNKTDIYRAIGDMLLRDSIEKARAALTARGSSFRARLETAIETALISMIRQISQSPHGAELLDMENSLAGDIAQIWRQDLVGLLAEAIGQEASRTGTDLAAKGLSAAVLANLLLDGVEGMKMRVTDPDEQRAGARELIRVVELVLRP